MPKKSEIIVPADVFEPVVTDGAIEITDSTNVQEFLTDFDKEVLESLITFHNRPFELVKIATPALISLALCPFTLYLYAPIVDMFWPKDRYVVMPNINEAIACFLAPAGLVYATSFGFAFQSALNKQSEILNKMTYELGMIDQIMTMTSKLKLGVEKTMAVYKAAKTESIFMILQVENRQPSSFKTKPMEDIKGTCLFNELFASLSVEHIILYFVNLFFIFLLENGRTKTFNKDTHALF